MNKTMFALLFLSVLAVASPAISAPMTASQSALQQKAIAGDDEAQFILGGMYVYGQGVPQDYAEAVKWCRKAAEQGNDKAQFNLGNMYYTGQGVSQDYVQAYKWFALSKAASNREDKSYIVSNSFMDMLTKQMTPDQIAQAQAEASAWAAKHSGQH